MTTATAPAPTTTQTATTPTTTQQATTSTAATANTSSAAGAKPRAAKQPKAPLLSAEKSIQKQIEVINNTTGLTPEHRQLVIDALSGLHLMISKDLDALADPTNPPAPDSAWGKVIALGRSRRGLAVLHAALAPSDTTADEEEGTASERAGF